MQINISVNEKFDSPESIARLAFNLIEETTNNGFAVTSIIINGEMVFEIGAGFDRKFTQKLREGK